MVDYEQAIKKLENHASLSNELPDKESLQFAWWRFKQSGDLGNLASLCEDVIDCLQVVNRHINGDPPSPLHAENQFAIDRRLVYAMSCMIDMLMREIFFTFQKQGGIDQKCITELQTLAWQVSFAWGCVLAGDVDSLRETIRFERFARDI